MKSISFALMIFSFALSAQAALMMKPGKWRINSTMTHDGKTAPSSGGMMAKRNAAMRNMTPAKRKEMEQMMAKMREKFGQKHGMPDQAMPKVGFDKDGMTVCYTKEMLESGLNLKKEHEARKCKISDQKHTPQLVSMKFNCENGSAGSSEWRVIDETHMSGSTKIVNAKGSKSEVKYQAEYLGAKCD